MDVRVYREAVLHAAAGYAYVNMPKAACTSIKTAIAQHLGIVEPGRGTELLRSLRPWRVAGGILALPELIRWTVVRHPLDRLLSCWTSKCGDPPPDPDCGPILLGMSGWTFRQFVMHVCTLPTEEMDPHFCPQWELGHLDGVRLFDEAWRMEDLGTVWPWLQQRFPGLPGLQRLNASAHNPWLESYEPDMLEAALARYACDFAFGYARDGGLCPPSWRWHPPTPPAP